MDSRLLVPATAALLDGWCGPVVCGHGPPRKGASFALDGTSASAWVRWEHQRSGDPGGEFVALERMSLDLSRAECRDRVARVLAAAVDLDPRAHWKFGPGFQMRAKLETRHWSHVAATVPTGVPCPWDSRMRVYDAPVLGSLDPLDDTRLPDGSRRVDALALAAVAREVLGAR